MPSDLAVGDRLVDGLEQDRVVALLQAEAVLLTGVEAGGQLEVGGDVRLLQPGQDDGQVLDDHVDLAGLQAEQLLGRVGELLRVEALPS